MTTREPAESQESLPPEDKNARADELLNSPELGAVLAALANAPCFGPSFFVSQLAPFVRDSCPSPGEGLPRVLIHLSGGDLLEVCHVIALSPRWVALAVFDEDARMRTEIVPYVTISRVAICAPQASAGDRKLGFRQATGPMVIDNGTSSRAREP